MTSALTSKYNIPGPRYTSYPTVPYWTKDNFSSSSWLGLLQEHIGELRLNEGISIYIHLPFCESLCTFCACHKRITKQHGVEEPYIDTLLKEWDLYCDLFPQRPLIKEIHLGGGTPTFFHPKNLHKLIRHITSKAEPTADFELSYEGHPNNTTREHLQTLYDLGSRRNSFGVQDYDLKVQKTINRIQPFEKVKNVTSWSREIGYHSISHDLVFGLPHQTLESMINTINLTKELRPDRIALYSYAHVPWIKNVGQRGFSESDLPNADQKRILYQKSKQLLDDLGYVEIGMDHFALESDSLYKALKNRKLHRNFMGYTSNKTQLMVGLGMSSISDCWYGFAQNAKTLDEYTEGVNRGTIPIFRGHRLSPIDLIIRKHILNIMCHFETSWSGEGMQFSNLNDCLNRLEEMEKDGLVVIDRKNRKLTLPEHARPYVRNVCMAFDLHLLNNRPQTRVFSMTI